MGCRRLIRREATAPSDSFARTLVSATVPLESGTPSDIIKGLMRCSEKKYAFQATKMIKTFNKILHNMEEYIAN